MFKKALVAIPPIGHHPSRKKWEAASWEKILKSEDLLRLLITSHERHDLVMRAAALDRLFSGKSYKQIGEELWLSPQTVSGIKKAALSKTYRSYLERSKKERKKKIYSSKIKVGKIRPFGRPRRTKYGIVYIP